MSHASESLDLALLARQLALLARLPIARLQAELVLKVVLNRIELRLRLRLCWLLTSASSSSSLESGDGEHGCAVLVVHGSLDVSHVGVERRAEAETRIARIVELGPHDAVARRRHHQCHVVCAAAPPVGHVRAGHTVRRRAPLARHARAPRAPHPIEQLDALHATHRSLLADRLALSCGCRCCQWESVLVWCRIGRAAAAAAAAAHALAHGHEGSEVVAERLVELLLELRDLLELAPLVLLLLHLVHTKARNRPVEVVLLAPRPLALLLELTDLRTLLRLLQLAQPLLVALGQAPLVQCLLFAPLLRRRDQATQPVVELAQRRKAARVVAALSLACRCHCYCCFVTVHGHLLVLLGRVARGGCRVVRRGCRSCCGRRCHLDIVRLAAALDEAQVRVDAHLAVALVAVLVDADDQVLVALAVPPVVRRWRQVEAARAQVAHAHARRLFGVELTFN